MSCPNQFPLLCTLHKSWLKCMWSLGSRPTYCLLITPSPKSYMANLWRNLGNCSLSTSTCWNKQFLLTVAANEFLVLSPFFWFGFILKLSAFKLPRFVCLGTVFGARTLLFNWTMSFPCQWSTLHIPHLLRSWKEFKQMLWGLRQLLLCRADAGGMLSSFKWRSPHVTKSWKWFCFQKVERS